MNTDAKKRLIKVLKEISIILLIGVIYYIFNRLTNISIPCLFKEITGLYCPGCGITRMCISIIHLDFYNAFRNNVFLFCLLPIILIFAVVNFINYIKKGKFIQSKAINIIILIVGILTIIYWILRNINTFSFLQPIQ